MTNNDDGYDPMSLVNLKMKKVRSKLYTLK